MTKNWQGLEQLGDTIVEIDNHIKEQATSLLESGEVPSIKADEIIENMEGYSATKGTEVTDNTCIYCGAVKNGNKLTLVYFCSFYKTPDTIGNKTIAEFVVPNSVYNKLYPTTISGQAVLYRAPIICIGDTSADVNTYFYFYKANNNKLHININVGNLTAGYKYFARFEATFLLSDSLIS